MEDLLWNECADYGWKPHSIYVEKADILNDGLLSMKQAENLRLVLNYSAKIMQALCVKGLNRGLMSGPMVYGASLIQIKNNTAMMEIYIPVTQ